MPDLVTHYYFGEQVLASLPETMRAPVEKDIFFHTTPGPDVWFTLGFFGGRHKANSPRGNYMHHHDTGAFLTALARECRSTGAKDQLYSYLVGFLCHYALDSTTHPYICYRTGDYNGTKETLPYRGNHTRMERAIDCHILRTEYGLVPGQFSFVERMLPLCRLPETLKEPLGRVYAAVYGWEDVWNELNVAIGHHRLFYRLIRDRFHLVNGVTRLTDNGKSRLDYRLLSYRNRDIDPQKLDYLNEGHALWRHPKDPSFTSTASFFELMEMARQKARQMIEIIYYYVYQGEDYDLSSLLGNISYSTGLDCDDPRNDRPGMYDALPFV